MSKLKHVTIATHEPEKTARFYVEVFELQMVGTVDNENFEGYYLTDGNLNLAILRFKNEAVAGSEYGTEYTGIHHIGFQVEDVASVDAKLRASNSPRLDEMNHAMESEMGKGHGGRNVETRYSGPDGVIIDISHRGWVGA
jgi:catechol 2,3-dioxygenase-like lactoylglutathione lyase family enzyme